MTEQALLKAKIDLFNIISNHCLESYRYMNLHKNGKRKSYKHIPYSKPSDAIEAQEVYNLICGESAEDITLDIEEQVKAFLMPYRTHRTEYLKEEYKGGNWYYAEQKAKLGMEV
jgi:hypothetical protein